MTVKKPDRSRRRWPYVVRAAASVLTGALLVLALDVAGWVGHRPEESVYEPGSGGSADPLLAVEAEVMDVVPVQPAKRNETRPAENPRSVRLPSGRAVPVAAVSSTDAGVLAVPGDIRAAGWWRGGARVGDPFGSTLVAAHIDGLGQGLGPFAELLGVEPGARIVVTSHRLRQVFRVRSLRVVPRASVRDVVLLSSPSGPRRLTLVTCAGPFEADEGGYQNLAVVTAVPSGPPVERRGAR